jgi:hypothetical protein
MEKTHPHAGRPKKYGEETSIICIKAPLSKKEEIRKLFYKILQKYEKL